MRFEHRRCRVKCKLCGQTVCTVILGVPDYPNPPPIPLRDQRGNHIFHDECPLAYPDRLWECELWVEVG